ncbi:MAG: glycosyltransferase [Ignavibacterium sp.]|nr:glycosyltransferase [Ignavibacterium sp.]
MRISIITVTLNNKAGLLRAIESVRSQTYKNIEHIIVDGGSTDGTVELMYNEEFRMYNLKFISEKDDGIYDAINKGIKLATGDVIGLLHSDDFYADEFVLERYAEVFFGEDKSVASLHRNDKGGVEAVYSDLVYVKDIAKVDLIPSALSSIPNSQSPTPYSTIRYWKAQKSQFTTETQRHREILNGWMPPHPTLFLRKEVFEKYGLYRTDMKIAADYEMILRLFYKSKITSHYLPITTYCMTIGGASNKSLKNILRKSSEDYQAMK